MKQSHVGGIALLVCLIVVAAIVLGAIPRGSAPPPTADSEPPLVIGDTMNMLIAGAASVSDLEAAGIPEPEELNVPKGVARYDLVTFDHAALNRQVQGGVLPLRIHGKEHRAELQRMNFEQIDDGIDSYEGTIVGADGSDVLLTTTKNGLTGSVTLDRETFWITGVEPRSRAEQSASPLHIIYSSKDVRQP